MDNPITAPKSNKVLWIIIVALIIIIGAAAAVFLILNKSNNFENKNTTLNNNNSDQVANKNASTNQNANLNENINLNENANLNINVEPVNSNTNNNENTNATNGTITDEVNPVRPPRDETVVTASSTLTDGSGFDYSPSQVIDQDYSTAWVEATDGNGIGEWIKMQFSAPAQINTVGIVPGYARDTNTYEQNNRIKSFALEFSDGTTITKELPDQYGLHLVTFPTVTTDYIFMTIKSVYPGTKYADSPIAELDVWSDYVLQKDTEAALRYYETYKESAAPQPTTKYIGQAYMAIGIMGSPTPEIPVSFYPPATEPFIAAAEIPASTPDGLTFVVKWYNEGHLFKTETITSYATAAAAENITLSSAAYIKDLSGATATAWALGDYTVEWYENDFLSKTIDFAVTPE